MRELNVTDFERMESILLFMQYLQRTVKVWDFIISYRDMEVEITIFKTRRSHPKFFNFYSFHSPEKRYFEYKRLYKLLNLKHYEESV